MLSTSELSNSHVQTNDVFIFLPYLFSKSMFEEIKIENKTKNSQNRYTMHAVLSIILTIMNYEFSFIKYKIDL